MSVLNWFFARFGGGERHAARQKAERLLHSNFSALVRAQGDWLALLHSGTAQYEFGAGKTELSAIRL